MESLVAAVLLGGVVGVLLWAVLATVQRALRASEEIYKTSYVALLYCCASARLVSRKAR
jgi:hypothetical protein